MMDSLLLHSVDCSQLANTYGGHMIVPGTVGLASTGYYHVASYHHCNTYQRIDGQNFQFSTQGSGQADPAARCMIGIAMNEVF